MSRYAIISDIHGNLHALQAVFARMHDLDIDEMICLGDVVGYGPNPGKCLDLVMRYASICVRGNHEDGVIDPNERAAFNGTARQAIEWTHGALGPLHINAISRLPVRTQLDGRILCTHESPDPDKVSYIHEAMSAALAMRALYDSICLIGHTHVPVVFEAPPTGGAEVSASIVVAHEACDGVSIELDPANRYICNPGSVGQPRDADPRASFAVLDTDAQTFTVHRTEYDIEAAQQATREAGLPDVLGQRLALGA